ncbi:hypothetical protein ACLOJK_019067 [Asimina triloba]
MSQTEIIRKTANVTAIEEAKYLSTLKVDDLIGPSMTHEHVKKTKKSLMSVPMGLCRLRTLSPPVSN